MNMIGMIYCVLVSWTLLIHFALGTDQVSSGEQRGM